MNNYKVCITFFVFPPTPRKSPYLKLKNMFSYKQGEKETFSQKVLQLGRGDFSGRLEVGF